jgi:hypothetical protein
MSTTTDRRWPHRRPTPGGVWAGSEARDVQFGEAIAYLDAPAAHMRARGWIAYIKAPAGRMATLFVRDPFDLPAQADTRRLTRPSPHWRRQERNRPMASASSRHEMAPIEGGTKIAVLGAGRVGSTIRKPRKPAGVY